MERAAAVLVGGIGLVLLTLAAMAVGGPDPDRAERGVDLAVFATTAPLVEATVLGVTASSSPAMLASTTTVAPTTTLPPAPPAPAAPAAPLPPGLVEAVRRVTDGGVRFAVNRAELDAPAVERLAQLAEELRARPDVVVVVVGHTDSTGGDHVNRPLSERRAQAVVALLVSRGVLPSQLRAEGVGPDRPRAGNDTVAGRQANRRSEVVLEPGR